jgi:hypothetical protein
MSVDRWWLKLTKINRNDGENICPSDTKLAQTDPALNPSLRGSKIKMICVTYKE